MYIRIYIFRFFSLIGYYKILSIVPCAVSRSSFFCFEDTFWFRIQTPQCATQSWHTWPDISSHPCSPGTSLLSIQVGMSTFPCVCAPPHPFAKVTSPRWTIIPSHLAQSDSTPPLRPSSHYQFPWEVFLYHSQPQALLPLNFWCTQRKSSGPSSWQSLWHLGVGVLLNSIVVDLPLLSNAWGAQ